MPYKEKDTQKLYYTIGEVAEKFKVNISLIRFWEKEFDIIKPQKNKKGNRLFTQEDLDNFYIIFHLVKERGYTLQGAKEKLKVHGKEVTAHAEVVKTLNRIKTFLLDVKESL
ncbi:MAG: MerR family transcriptional regulator [Bacteroidia bacterium]|nr:MerR family transcriptional regulator [Bacteroidia bacterium]